MAERKVRSSFLAGLVLAALTIAVYAPSVHVPFVFDDVNAIVDNPNVRLWPSWDAALAPDDSTVAGRPLVALSFALDYAAGELSPFGYHVVNIGLHVLAACVLMGLVRLSLVRCGWSDRRALGVGLATASLWAIHPLQTESVAYVVQRTELLMSLCFLGVLYALARAVAAREPRGWMLLAVVCAWAGVASKENMVAVPLAALLWDRAFVAGSLGEAWRRRGRLHLAIASCWLPLALLVSGGHRDASVGTDHGVSVWRWLLTQSEVLLHYLRLAIWPDPLVISYGWPVATGLADVWPFAVGAAALVLVVCVTAWVRPRAGFAAVVALFVLAPTTSVVPIVTEVAAERRMYLPLAAVCLAAAWLAERGARWVLRRRGGTAPAARLLLPAWLVLLAVCAFVSRERIAVWRSPVALWEQTVEARPENPVAWFMLGNTYRDEGLALQSMAMYDRALQLDPDDVGALTNLANALIDQAEYERAVALHTRVVELAPDAPNARSNLVIALRAAGRTEEAVPHIRAAVQLAPDALRFRWMLADALLDVHAPVEQVEAELGRALALAPEHAGLLALQDELRERRAADG